jgi:hypothetical protein
MNKKINIKNSNFRRNKTGNSIIDKGDYIIIDGKLILTNAYYKKRGKVNPKKNDH